MVARQNEFLLLEEDPSQGGADDWVFLAALGEFLFEFTGVGFKTVGRSQNVDELVSRLPALILFGTPGDDGAGGRIDRLLGPAQT